MAKEITTTDVPAVAAEPTEFKVTLTEFLSELPVAKIETKAGFTRAVTNAGLETGGKLRSEWQRLLSMFENCPTKIKFADWVAKGGK